jgi:Dyp-type peroxidase family
MVDQKDVQGFVLRAYGKMRYTRYILLHIDDAILAKQWLSKISGQITDGTHYPETTCINLAVTCPGLRVLGMHEDNIRSFGREFREGMVTEHRQRMLNDFGASDPALWDWGGSQKVGNSDMNNIHLMLLLFAKTEDLMKQYHSEVSAELVTAGLSVVKTFETSMLDSNKENFGFTDGISQPTIKGIGDDESNEHNVVATGEFLLGYKNEYNVFPDSPFLMSEQGDMNLLPTDVAGSGLKDIGRNGSYLVFRQMEQHVDRFWEFMNDKTRSADGTLDETESIKLASKMVGRWPSGAPLAKYPDKDPFPDGMCEDDNFGYKDDADGLKCPFGSHMRRNNPRDAFEDNKPKLSLKLTKKHRIIRRGRPYGEPFAGNPNNYKPEGKVGLHFMCVNSDISKQFEFVQHTWANFPRFQNLYNDPDPINGALENIENECVQNFTIQAEPVNKCITNLKSFVTIRGGGYFFFPSINVISYLSTI